MSADACWNNIGVAGDKSCDKLAAHVHCRNCDVYSGAAQRSLQRPVGDTYRHEWAALLRMPAPAPASLDGCALAFRIGREWLALPAAMVSAVAPEAPLHRLPHRSGGALHGIVNVGGILRPAVSLAALLGIDERDVPAETGRHAFARLLVVEWAGQQFALPVADIEGIIRYASASLAAPAATINRGLVRYLSGVATHGARHIGVLDAPLLGQQMTRLVR